MKGSAALRQEANSGDCWNRFRPGDWTTSINVRDFIVRNVTPYKGNEGFVTLADDRCDKSSIQSRSRRSSHLAPGLHGRGSECPVCLR